MINKETHTRFWVTLKNEDFAKLSLSAKARNLSISAFAGQLVTDYLHAEDNRANCGESSTRAAFSPSVLNEMVTEALKEKTSGDRFTIKDLFHEEEWIEMSRSEKAIAAKILASIQRSSPNLEIYETRNKTAIYRKN